MSAEDADDISIHDEVPRPSKVCKGLAEDLKSIQEMGMITQKMVVDWALQVNPEKTRRIVGCAVTDLKAFAQLAYAKGLEDAAKVCDAQAAKFYVITPVDCALAIRAITLHEQEK